METELTPLAVLPIDGLDAEVTDVRRVPLSALAAPSPIALQPYPQVDRGLAERYGLWLCTDARPDRTGTTQGRHLVTGDKLRVRPAGHPTPWNPALPSR